MKAVKTFAFRDRLRGHKDTVVGLTVADNGSVLYSGSREGRFRGKALIALLLMNNLKQPGT